MNNKKKYFFLGIGGIGMSALARYFKAKGFEVAGYDRTQTPLTDDLQLEGISITFDESVTQIPAEFLDPSLTEVIYTPAIPQSHPQFCFFKDHNFLLLKRSQVLGEITRSSKGICVAGTHGKTTTSTITAHLLFQSSVKCNAFLGGISNNYNTNLLLSNKSDLVVIEADEYDRSFHQLTPSMAVITSVDPDHLDIYKSPGEFEKGFEYFTSLIKPGGALVLKKGIKLLPKLQAQVTLYTYSMDDGGDFHAQNIRTFNGEILFDFVSPTYVIPDVCLRVPARINVENSVAAMALAWLNGVDKEQIKNGIASYTGIYRRFNILYNSPQVTFIDDYAHHPSELNASISSVRNLFPNRKITGVFQPHLYSRTHDFAPEFAAALSQLDELILLDIYPARELPMEGVTSKLIFDNVKLTDKILCSKENLLTLLDKKEFGVLVTFGAGDIDKLVPKIKELLESKLL